MDLDLFFFPFPALTGMAVGGRVEKERKGKGDGQKRRKISKNISSSYLDRKMYFDVKLLDIFRMLCGEWR